MHRATALPHLRAILAAAVLALVGPAVALGAAPGDLDASFDPQPDARVEQFALQPDGRIIVGGNFQAIGSPATTYRRIARLDLDGSIDSTFADPNANNDNNAVALQGDGKVVIGGKFTTIGGVARTHVARLTAGGALDTSFTPPTLPTLDNVYAVALQADGKVLVGGGFEYSDGTTTFRDLIRLNADGTPDTAFLENLKNTTLFDGTNGTVSDIRVAADGKIYVGGLFSDPGNSIFRLNSDGTRDLTLPYQGFTGGTGISAIAVQPDGDIVVVGDFTAYTYPTSQPATRIARIDPSGNLDTAFAANASANSVVKSVALQDDGKILVGGTFTAVGSTSTARNRAARLAADGTVDSAFDPDVNDSGGIGVQALAMQADGQVLLGGGFQSVGGTARVNMARVLGTVPDAPPAASAVAGDAQAVVSWTGVPGVTSYLVTSQPDGLTCTSVTTQCVVSGLRNGIAYTFSVESTSALGSSSAASAGPVTPLGAPQPPVGPTAVAGDGEATVSWAPPAADGGVAVTGYTVTAAPGGRTCTVAAPATTCTVTGLTNGTAYTFTVTADNGVGISSASVRSAEVTPTAPTPAPSPAPAPVPTPTPGATCPSTFYQQAARSSRSARAPGGTSAIRVVSRIRIYEDLQAACRTSLTFIFRDARTKKRLAQLPGSTLGFRTLKGKDFSAPVISWPTAREMRFSGGDTTGQDRKNARLVLVSYLKRVKGMPAMKDVEMLIVRRIPADVAQPASATNPLFAQRNALGTAVSWAAVS